jgi:nicotinamidase-related amidase
MRVILDECLPRRLGLDLSGHLVSTVPLAGWAGVSNGKLLACNCRSEASSAARRIRKRRWRAALASRRSCAGLPACAASARAHTAAMAREPHRTTDILDAVALLVIDMQEGFLQAIPGFDGILERCAFAVEAARALGLKVLFTEQVPSKLGPTHPALLARAPGARVFSKDAFSALQAGGLQEHLRKLGVYHLLLVGIETPVCVYQTALHAHDSDFDVTILADCVAGRRADDARVVLQALAIANCHVLPAETVFYSMLGTSAHPRFRGYTALVKRYGRPGALERAPQPPPVVETPAAPLPPPPTAAPGVSVVEPAPAAPRADALATPAEGPNEDDESPAPDDGPHGGDTDAPAGESETSAADDTDRSADAAPRKRSRRRRGGARRRKAKERAAARHAEGVPEGAGQRVEPPAPAAPATPEPLPPAP